MKKGNEMQPKILIIGAGLGGLALAQGLTKNGFDVTVFERDISSTSRPQGHRIFIRSMGIQALVELLTPEKMDHLFKAKITDVGSSFICANEKMESFFSVQGQEAGAQFLRSELRCFLQQGTHIEWNKRFIKFEDHGNQVIAHFEDGTSFSGDLLVGCDGAASSVRKLLPSIYKEKLGSIPKMINSNQAVLGAQIDRTPEWEKLLPLNQNGFVRYLGIDLHDIGVCFSQRPDKTPSIVWAVSEQIKDHNAPWYQFDQGLDCKKRILDHCKQVMNHQPWHENLRKLVNQTPIDAIMPPWLIQTTQFADSDQFPMVPTARVTLVGDSAHVMSNAKGLGGNNVLEDARLLSNLIVSSSKPIDWPKLIEKYEREMFARAKIAVQESETAVKYFRSLRSAS